MPAPNIRVIHSARPAASLPSTDPVGAGRERRRCIGAV